MKNIEFTVEQVEFKGWNLWISANVKGDYDSRVRNPKVTVTFDSGKQTRRVPLIIKSYIEKDGSFLIYGQYRYDIRQLFFDEKLGKKITLWFDVMYGEEYIERIPFQMGEILNQKYDIGDGDIEEDEDDEDEDDDNAQSSNSGNRYDIAVSANRGEIDLISRYEIKKETTGKKILNGFQRLVELLWKILQFLVGICLLPVFIIDGILAVFGCVPRKARIHATHGSIYVIKHARWRLTTFCRMNVGILPMKLCCMTLVNRVTSLFPIKKNRIVFLSNRRNDLSGNFEFVYNILKKDENLDIRFVLDNHDVKHMKFSNMLRLARYFASSEVILVDDFMELLFKLPKRQGTTLIQLWHACGAFKTFGCSRMGKRGGQNLKSPNHRSYDYATVSSKEIAKFYAEGFGLSEEKVVATGVPRTDIFFDTSYKEKVSKDFYKKYPKLKEKKILLFAPTFRGNGKNTGYYPVELFDVNRLYEALGEEYAIIIKHHPFVRNRNVIEKKYRDYIIDLSKKSELNDLLFITDVLITDYSSVVFEASLLKIPMLFYVFDLEQYIATRGFYYEFETFVPGKIVYHFDEISDAISKNDLEQQKIEAFRDRFFDGKDGRSSERTVDLIYENLSGSR